MVGGPGTGDGPNGAALFEAANKLRGSVESAEYKHLVLGLLFLKYISDAFEQRRQELEAELAQPQSDAYIEDVSVRAEALEDRDEYVAKNVFWVPESARWGALLAAASQPDIARRIDDALSAIEQENQALRNALPRIYARAPLSAELMGSLVETIAKIGFGKDPKEARDTERSLARWAFAGTVAGYLKDRLPEATINPWGDELPPVILTESKGMAEVLEITASAYACPIAGTKGQSAGFLRTVLAPLLSDARRVLYLGDRDRSGRDIEANTRRTLEGAAGALDWTRIGMTEAQTAGIEPIWKVDGRDEAGDWAWEVEALGQARVVALVRDALDKRMPEPLVSVLEREDAERATVEVALHEALGGEAA